MKADTILKNSLVCALGVMIAGLVFYYGKDLPVIGDAAKGFDV